MIPGVPSGGRRQEAGGKRAKRMRGGKRALRMRGKHKINEETRTGEGSNIQWHLPTASDKYRPRKSNMQSS